MLTRENADDDGQLSDQDMVAVFDGGSGIQNSFHNINGQAIRKDIITYFIAYSEASVAGPAKDIKMTTVEPHL